MVLAGADPVAPAPAPVREDVVLLVATRAEAAGAGLRVAGIPVIRRSLEQLTRAGFARIVIASDGAVPLPALPPTAVVRRVDGDADLEALRRELGDPPAVAADVVRPSGGRDLSAGLRVTDRASLRTAEDAVFRQLLRGDLGLVARWLNKPVSFRITRYLLCKLPVTPNQVTIGAALVGLTGCALIAFGGYTAMAVGFFLAHAQSVLDGCDGELARVRFQQSAIGEWLDTVVDDGLNLALVSSIGIGLSRGHGGAPVWMVLGFTACGMFLTYNVVAYRMLRKQGVGGEVLKVKWWFGGGRDSKQIAADAGRTFVGFFYSLGRRDFFCFAWLVLALAGQVEVVVFYALVISFANFVVALGQVLLGGRGVNY